ncbi:PCYCGC domain-containing protein [Sediminibacillus albus]|uniref:Lipoprotein n=1 Tax=Sediminibacillus albus TaxID=407036 RepID=A0A1G9CBY3_9BACI|nr:PCYCGC domain-containing protein [Sediminibacillus albus]SDK49192.1 Protein of unknown function with PCYCGC motif-containing protein [Sediminibacillus albus]
MRKASIYGIVLLLALLALAACSNEQQKQSRAENLAPNHEMTASTDELPQFLSKASEDLQLVYQTAAEHKQLLEHIPCYCGCSDDAVGHKDNYDCFVYEKKENGEVTWDTHGMACQVCIDTAVYSIKEYNNGTEISAIREHIDNTYQGKGYPEPTPTPEI